MVPLVLLILPPVQEHDQHPHPQQTQDRYVYHVVHPRVVLQESLDAPVVNRPAQQNQLAVRYYRRPLVAHTVPRVPHRQVLDVVVGPAQAIRAEGHLQSAIVPLRLLVEHTDTLVSVQFGDSPLNGDSD